MHKNLKKIINIALIGAISSNNIIVFADELNPNNLTENIETQNIDNYLIKGSKSTNQSPILTNAILKKLSETTRFTDENEEIQENRSGTLTVKYIDWKTNEEIKSSDFFDNIALGSYTYVPDEIAGYRLVSNSRVSVAFTEENPNQTIEFKYEKIKDYTVSADKTTIVDAAQKGQDLLIIGANGSLRVYNNTLKSVKDLVDEISINITDTIIKDSTISSLILTEKLQVIDSFNAHSNLSELKDGYNVSISRSLNGNDYVNKKLYLYRINESSKNSSLQYIGEYTDVNGLARFDINSKLLDGSDFIITSNKRLIIAYKKKTID